MKSLKVILFSTAVSLIGCAASPSAVETLEETQEENVASVDEALTPSGGDQCATVDQATVAAVLALVESAQDRADTVLAAHPNHSHRYMAQYLVDSLVLAHNRLDAEAYWLFHLSPSDNNPDVTNYAEGIHVFEEIRHMRTDLDVAWHYALLSTYYLGDDDAYFAFEDIALANEIANDLATRAGRCFLNAAGYPSGN